MGHFIVEFSIIKLLGMLIWILDERILIGSTRSHQCLVFILHFRLSLSLKFFSIFMRWLTKYILLKDVEKFSSNFISENLQSQMCPNFMLPQNSACQTILLVVGGCKKGTLSQFYANLMSLYCIFPWHEIVNYLTEMLMCNYTFLFGTSYTLSAEKVTCQSVDIAKTAHPKMMESLGLRFLWCFWGQRGIEDQRTNLLAREFLVGWGEKYERSWAKDDDETFRMPLAIKIPPYHIFLHIGPKISVSLGHSTHRNAPTLTISVIFSGRETF